MLTQWSDALRKGRKELGILGGGAYDAEKLVGMAGCSAGCDEVKITARDMAFVDHLNTGT